MAIAAGTYTLGPDDGTLTVRTGRQGAAAKAGHDLLIEVGSWSATLEAGEGPGDTTIALTADARSLRVLEGTGGMKALDDDDRSAIRQTIDDEVLRGTAIAFRSTGVEADGSRLRVHGELELLGTRRPIAFDLVAGSDGRLRGSARVRQSDFGMKPYSALFGTLKVADDVEVAIDARLPAPGRHHETTAPAQGGTD